MHKASKNFARYLSHELLHAKTFNQFLQLAQLYGRVCWQSGQPPSRSEKIESLGERLFYESHQNDIDRILFARRKKKNHISHVCTDIYEKGGHTLLLFEYIRALDIPPFTQSLYVTRPSFANSKNYPASKISLVDFAALSGEYSRRLLSLLNHVACSQAVLLYIHPDDIISALVTRICGKLHINTIFVNHADHAFSYGRDSANLIVEVSGFGFHMTRHVYRDKPQSFVGIPISIDPPHHDNALPLALPSNKTILSIGGSHKYRPNSMQSFPRFLSKLLSKSSLHAIIVGSTGMESWWRSLSQDARAKVHFIPSLTHSQCMNLMKTADIYVDSFPVTGGTVFTQAFLSGCNVFGISNDSSGYSFADCLKSPDEQTLINNICNNVDKVADIRKLDSLRNRITDYFSRASTATRLSNLILYSHVNGLPPELDREYDLTYYVDNPFSGIFDPTDLSINNLEFTSRARLALLMLLFLISLNLKTRYLKIFIWLLAGPDIIATIIVYFKSRLR